MYLVSVLCSNKVTVTFAIHTAYAEHINYIIDNLLLYKESAM